ncbi:universal stress protein [Pseudonocardia hydrocarbonoxydans]|uniref:universal stress protein n=1 Tax=Pseudonocardia hydrocarbonoxydans TaxID=76726 RepID=UPI0031D58BF4
MRWATAEARRRALPLAVVATDPRRARSMRRSTFAATLAAALGGRPDESLPTKLRRLSVGAAALVLPATLPDLGTVVAEAHCPVVTVPAHDPSPAASRGPIVVGVAPWTAQSVIALAFQEASDRRAPLHAVRVWSEPRIDLGWLRPDRIAEWDTAEERVHHELELALSGWTIAHPEVPVETIVVQDQPAGFLLALSHRAQLLVLGRSVRGALLASIAGSPVDALVRGARCPVMVVPGDGPPRTTWLPTAQRARPSPAPDPQAGSGRLRLDHRDRDGVDDVGDGSRHGRGR